MGSDKTRQIPREIDDIEDRMGAVHPLDFDARQDQEHRLAGAVSAEEAQRVREAGRSGGETLGTGVHEDGISLDDLSPETLYDETGARGPDEPGGDGPADQQLREVDISEIGAGEGLDEGEAARESPLDAKFWDGRR